MENPGLPDALWRRLDGRLWHSTSISGLEEIITAQEIRPMLSTQYHGNFCRSNECLSLFDFGPSATDNSHQFDNWSIFFGQHHQSNSSVWLEVDRNIVCSNLLDAQAARELWSKTAPSTTFFPGVEACHRGPICLSAVRDVLGVCDCCREVFEDFGGIGLSP
jgi:hypothetical protein